MNIGVSGDGRLYMICYCNSTECMNYVEDDEGLGVCSKAEFVEITSSHECDMYQNKKDELRSDV